MFGNNSGFGGGNRGFGFGRGGGIGGGMGAGRIMQPMMNAWRDHYQGQPRGAFRQDMRSWMGSEPVQDWRSQFPQRPEGGWENPLARQTAFTGWFNQMPDLPWGAAPELPTPQAGQGNALAQGWQGRPGWLGALSRRFR
jgi:hypothetical protein